MLLNKEGDRLKAAQQAYQSTLNDKMQEAGINHLAYQIYLRAFKQENIIEIWIKNKTATKWKFFISYPFCKCSGHLGPKRKEGDLQIPEGFYYIDRFNPKSQFYLSLGLNYPNISDKILSDSEKPGSDIFIHGACITVGCIPITDEKIAELYVLASNAFEQRQQKIPVHIFPTMMDQKKLKEICKSYPQHTVFWQQLKIAYAYFETNKRLLKYKVDADGAYTF